MTAKPGTGRALLSPLDGAVRYATQVEAFARAFSEEALFRQRFTVEVEWLLALAAEPGIAELAPIPPETAAILKGWVAEFGPTEVARIKEIERRINHDVKAVEYLLKEKLASIGLGAAAEFAHFACTSEDINNLAHALMLRDGLVTEVAAPGERLAWRTCGGIPRPTRTYRCRATPTASPPRRRPSERSWPSSQLAGSA